MLLKLNILFYSFLLVLGGCTDTNKKITLSGHTMGTTYHIVIINSDNQASSIPQDKLKQQIDLLLKSINQQMSTYQKDSEISQFNRFQKKEWFKVSSEFAFVVANAQKISQLSHGAFDITISPLVNLWGFGAKKQNNMPSKKQISASLANIGFKHLKVQEKPAFLKKEHLPLTINLSAIAKGFAVDKVSELLKNQGFNNHLVEIGGEIKAQGRNSQNDNWKIAIEQPKMIASDNSKPNTVIPVSNVGVATSGDYRNYFMKDGIRFSHTIDPKTGRPVTHHLASVTIINNSCMLADAYATAVMVMGEKVGKKFITKNNIKANLIIRNGASFTRWSNLLNEKSAKKGGGG